MPILARMLIGFGIIIALGIAQSVFTSYKIGSLSEQIRSAAAEPVDQVDSARSAWEAFGAARTHMDSVLEGISYQPTAAALAEFDRLSGRIDGELARFASTGLSPDARTLSDEIAAQVAVWKGKARVLLGAEPATAIPMPEVMARHAAEIRGGLERLVGAAIEGADASRARIEALAGSTRSTVMAIAGAAVLLGLAIALPLAFSLTRPLSRLQGRMVSMVDGDLATPISDQGRRDEVGGIARALGYFRDRLAERDRLESQTADIHRSNEEKLRETESAFTAAGREQAKVVEELGKAVAAVARGDLTVRLRAEVAPAYERLKQDFNEAVATLESIVATVASTTEDIRIGADEMSNAAGDLSRRTERQAADLAETSGALESVLKTVRMTADGVGRVQTAVKAADAEAVSSETVVKKAVEAMGRIEKSSEGISRIIGVIDEIAFQTNLLALNAGVEAARAGDSGRGFAVVAQEVRSLAQNSASAASEIKKLISAARPEVAQGVELVSEAGQALTRIGRQVAAINGVVADVAESAVAQANAIKGIGTSVSQIDQVTQQNAAMVEQSTAATYSLRQKTEELTESLGQFQIGTATPARAPAPAPARMGARRAA